MFWSSGEPGANEDQEWRIGAIPGLPGTWNMLAKGSLT